MNLESPKITIEKSSEKVFHFLLDVNNFKALMPKSISNFEVLADDTFLFTLKGMPEIVLKRKEAVPHSKITLGSADGKLDFTLTTIINEVEANKTEVKLNFSGHFNTMMAMMVKGPINNFIGVLTQKMSAVI